MSGSGRNRGEHPPLHGNLAAALSTWGAELQATESALEGPPQPLRAGELLAGTGKQGRYELRREIRYGDFPAWEALDGELRREVAILPFSVAFGDLPGESPPFGRHAGLKPADAVKLARLSAPNLIGMWDVGLHRGLPYLVMELYRGSTLAQRLAQGPIPIAEGLVIALDIAKGLAHAHRHDLVHGNLTPANVIFGEHGLKLLGTGIPPASDLAPFPVAPEQVAGAPGDTRSDVFALGVILFQMATGELPFSTLPEATQPRRARRLYVKGEVRRSWWQRALQRIGLISRSSAKDQPAEALQDVVNRMLATDPTTRPRDADDVLRSLEIVERCIARSSLSLTIAIRGAPEDCSIFEAELEAVAFQGDLPQGALEDHIAWCRSCAEKWDHEGSLYAHPPELKAKVLEAARREPSKSHGRTPTTDERRADAVGMLERFGPKVLAYLEAVLSDDERAREAFSLFAEMVWREVPARRDPPTDRVFAFRLASNAAKVVAHRKPEGLRSPGTEKEKLLASLSSDDRMLVLLRVGHELPWEEVAAVVGTDPMSARRRFEAVEKRLGPLSRLA